MVKQVTDQPSYIINQSLNIDQSNWDHPDHLAIGQRKMEKLFPTVAIEAGEGSPLTFGDPLVTDNLGFQDPLDLSNTLGFEDFLNRRLFNDALLIMHKGSVIHESYRNGMQQSDRHVIHSCTKSLCSMIAAMAVEEGKLNPNDLVSQYIPEFKSVSAWDEVTVQNVWDMQAGIEYSEDYTQPDADYWSYARAAGYYPPLQSEKAIGARAWAINNLNRQNYPPGTAFVYNSTLTNVLGMVLENIYGANLAQLFESKLYQPCGAENDGYFNTDSQGFPITEGQFSITLRDFARLAYPIINNGKTLNNTDLLPSWFIEKTITESNQDKLIYQAHVKDPVFTSGQYKNKFWVLEPEERCFTMLGIHGQFAWFDLEKDLMVVGMGSYPKQDGPLMMTTLKTLWHSIAEHV